MKYPIDKGGNMSEKEYKWLEDEDKCPHCGSKDVSPVHPFDYVKHCNK